MILPFSRQLKDFGLSKKEVKDFIFFGRERLEGRLKNEETRSTLPLKEQKRFVDNGECILISVTGIMTETTFIHLDYPSGYKEKFNYYTCAKTLQEIFNTDAEFIDYLLRKTISDRRIAYFPNRKLLKSHVKAFRTPENPDGEDIFI